MLSDCIADGVLVVALLEKQGRPLPEIQVETEPDPECLVIAIDGLQQYAWNFWRSPGIRMSRCDHGGVDATGLRRDFRVRVNNSDLVILVSRQFVCGGDTDNACTKDDDSHDRLAMLG